MEQRPSGGEEDEPRDQQQSEEGSSSDSEPEEQGHDHLQVTAIFSLVRLPGRHETIGGRFGASSSGATRRYMDFKFKKAVTDSKDLFR